MNEGNEHLLRTGIVSPFARANAALGTLRQHLEEARERGCGRISISQEALRRLESFPQRKRARARGHVLPPCPFPPGTPPPPPAVDSDEAAIRRRKLAEIEAWAASGERTRALGSLRDVMVFAVGSPVADLMFVGEAPGADEEAQREPFVGKAGQLLTKIIQAMGLRRSDVYISNVVKFRPSMTGQGSGNRKPTDEEIEACLPFVLEEIAVVQPKVIVALGATAAEGLLGIREPVSRMRSRFHDRDGIPAMVTYHPSYLLRNQALSERRKVWEDMLMVMEKLGLPISDKQRGFFLGK